MVVKGEHRLRRSPWESIRHNQASTPRHARCNAVMVAKDHSHLGKCWTMAARHQGVRPTWESVGNDQACTLSKDGKTAITFHSGTDGVAAPTA